MTYDILGCIHKRDIVFHERIKRENTIQTSNIKTSDSRAGPAFELPALAKPWPNNIFYLLRR
jgi:hypothetical protein